MNKKYLIKPNIKKTNRNNFPPKKIPPLNIKADLSLKSLLCKNDEINAPQDHKQLSIPPGHLKISKAMISLLKKKNFDVITWSEIASTAGVNEALIYKYFKDKRNLLHYVLQEYSSDFVRILRGDLDNTEGTFNKIKTFISSTLNYYQGTPVFAKILIIEIRNFPAFFTGETYELIREYADILLNIIEEGIKRGEIRSDISPRHIRQIIIGAIEHLCLPKIIFGTKIKTKEYTKEICKLVFDGIAKQATTGSRKSLHKS
jgi:TetR/AcrR family fatty acid metabolism transcriptional regulator